MSEIDIREKDKLDTAKIEAIATNWHLPDEEDLPEIQKIMLHLLEEQRKIKEKLNEMITTINKL